MNELNKINKEKPKDSVGRRRGYKKDYYNKNKERSERKKILPPAKCCRRPATYA